MKEYRIKISEGRGMFAKSNFGKYYIQIKDKDKWKNYKDTEFYDDWKSTMYYPTAEKATETVVELIKEELEEIRKEYEVRVFSESPNGDRVVKVITLADVAKALLEK